MSSANAAGGAGAAGNGGSLKINQPVNAIGLPEFGKYLNSKIASFKKSLGPDLDAAKFAVTVYRCVSKTPKLKQCTAESIYLAALECAELGLTPGTALQEAHLVPYGSVCTMIPGYQGLEQLAYNSSFVKQIETVAVYAEDEFLCERGTNARIVHLPGYYGEDDPEKVRFVYTVVHLTTGGVKFEVMSKPEIERIRRKSAGCNADTWVLNWVEMAKKTVLRRALKHVPKSPEMKVSLSKALAADNAAETGDRFAHLEFDNEEESTEQKPEPTRTNGVDAVKAQLGIPAEEQQSAGDPPGVEPSTGFGKEAVIEIAKGLQKQLGMNGQQSSAYNMRTVGKPAYGEMDEADLSKLVDSLQAELDKKAGQ